MRTKLGKQIAALREAKGLTQEELASKTGFQKQNICRIEQGKYSANIDILEKIADALSAEIEFKEKM